MKEKRIRFLNVEEARKFITFADKCDFDIDIYYNHIVMDGKSIMALLGMDLSQPVTVKYQGSNPRFEAVLSELSVG